MSKRIHDTPFRELVPPSIRDDATIAASSDALDGVLARLVRAVPNLLLFSRLDPAPGRLSPPLQRIVDASGGLKPLSEEELELLAWQFHVDFREVATTKEQLAAMVRNSIPWHRIKGTPAGITAALDLFGIAADVEEDGRGKHWATYQLGLKEITDMDTVRLVVSVANEMAPVRCRLFRMYTETFDLRPIIVDRDPVLGDGLLSYYSGVTVPGEDAGQASDLVVSFGTRQAFLATPYSPVSIASGITTGRGAIAPYLDAFTLGRSRLSRDIYPRNTGFSVSELVSRTFATRTTSSHPWRGAWDTRHWEEFSQWDRPLPQWSMYRRTISKVQLVPSWPDEDAGSGGAPRSGTLGDVNARLGHGPRYRLTDAPPVLGCFRLSASDLQVRLGVVEECFTTRAAAMARPLEHPAPAAGHLCVTALGTVPLHRGFWNGRWDERTWNGYVFPPAKITTYTKE